ncbi:hypothetical protein ARMGADRAFT_981710 [Armillaria gallica]|uniref:Uncharacterized protein n=1 Tax=Armillaria gallica TaxID=47427 RepID=A0A2H3EHH9_ARMGA|nr:hypothetical protein ARMGADRAFT_981710 [Armillaria gallica]
MVVQDVTLFPRALELPPPGTNYIAIIKPTLAGVLIAHSFTVILVPLLIALLYLSTPRGRRKPIFILNVITISLAFTTGVLLDYRGIRTILSPDNPPELAYNLVVGVFGSVQYILIDTILLLRLLAVYPLAYIGTRRYIGLITLPVLLKLARVINLFIFISVLVKATRNPATASLRVSQVWLQAPYLKIEWCMQLVDNMYASIFFLWRLVLRSRENGSPSPSIVSSSTISFTERLKILFWIAVTNFVVPTLFSVAQIIIVYRGVTYVAINDVVLANTSTAVILVVFATVWAGSSHWKRATKVSRQTGESLEQGGVTSNIIFHPRSLQSLTEGGIDEVLPAEGSSECVSREGCAEKAHLSSKSGAR